MWHMLHTCGTLPGMISVKVSLPLLGQQGKVHQNFAGVSWRSLRRCRSWLAFLREISETQSNNIITISNMHQLTSVSHPCQRKNRDVANCCVLWTVVIPVIPEEATPLPFLWVLHARHAAEAPCRHGTAHKCRLYTALEIDIHLLRNSHSKSLFPSKRQHSEGWCVPTLALCIC